MTLSVASGTRRRRTARAALVLFASGLWVHGAAACARWPAWEDFRASFVSPDGRVIDHTSPRRHTVSEGQAYAMLFALTADDRTSFDTLLRWTTNNLAQGDLSRDLPAWHWGRRDDDSYGPLDANPASDADLWIAYVLAEAARVWNEPAYLALSRALAELILRQSVAELPGLGPVLMPAPEGFRDEAGTVRLNPGYLPLQVLRRLAAAHPQQRERWQLLIRSSVQVLRRAAPRGIAPDWVRVDRDGRFLPDTGGSAIGSYDAIRVYLWLGLLNAADPERGALAQRFRPMARLIRRQGRPPERIDAWTGRVHDADGPGAFSAAVAPWLEATDPHSAGRQWRRVARFAPARDEYYGRALLLIAQGWREGRLRFGPDGELLRREGRCAAPQG